MITKDLTQYFKDLGFYVNDNREPLRVFRGNNTTKIWIFIRVFGHPKRIYWKEQEGRTEGSEGAVAESRREILMVLPEG